MKSMDSCLLWKCVDQLRPLCPILLPTVSHAQQQLLGYSHCTLQLITLTLSLNI